MTHPSAPGEDFGVAVRNLDGVDHVVVRGELDISSTSMLREAMLDPAVCAQAVLLVDLVQTHFIDSSGVASLVVAHRTTVARGARLVIACQDGLTLQVLDMAGLARVLEIVPDAREYLAAHSQVCGPSEPGTMPGSRFLSPQRVKKVRRGFRPLIAGGVGPHDDLHARPGPLPTGTT